MVVIERFLFENSFYHCIRMEILGLVSVDIDFRRRSVLISEFVLLQDFLDYSLLGRDIFAHYAFTESLWFSVLDFIFNEIVASVVSFILGAN